MTELAVKCLHICRYTCPTQYIQQQAYSTVVIYSISFLKEAEIFYLSNMQNCLIHNYTNGESMRVR